MVRSEAFALIPVSLIWSEKFDSNPLSNFLLYNLEGAVRKWADNYLSDCRSQQKTANNGIPMISLRMHKWKVVLENGFHKIRKQTEEIKPTPSSWTNWYQRKIQRA